MVNVGNVFQVQHGMVLNVHNHNYIKTALVRAVFLMSCDLSDDNFLSVHYVYTGFCWFCVEANTVYGVPCIVRRSVKYWGADGIRIIYSEREIFCNIETIPLVIDYKDLTVDSFAWFVIIII